MGKVLVVGAGGVGTVAVIKMAQMTDVFSEILLASRTKSKCDAIAARIGGNRVQTAQVDADNVAEMTELIRSFGPDLVVNLALPYQD
ncbi:saccharopine dehydrogenase family protein, partial [bacterium]|nr:saccharopine dehydrogenase family protein [bacterium]